VIVNGLSSNEISVRIDRSAPQVAPRLTSIAPETGSPGQYLTLSGSGFGSQLGTIWFTNTLDGVRTAATPDFPEECEVTQWTDSEIATVIPDTLPLGNYTVHIERPDTVASNAVAYVVIAGTPGPNVCALVPNQGLPGDEVRIIGGRFGSPGAVTFSDGRVAEVIRWAEDALVVRVPPAVLSGPVTVRSADNRLGNPKYFTVGVAGDGAAGRGAAAAFCGPGGRT
jgi:hypothetical protein